jgi:MraZ protein
MTIGQYSYIIDEKKRVGIPTKFRDAIEQGAVLTKGFEGCLYLYPQREWEKFLDIVNKLPYFDPATREMKRSIVGSAMDVKLDNAGRILVPDYLKDYAALTKNLIIIGLNDHIEIWDEDKWNKYSPELDKISDQLKQFGL